MRELQNINPKYSKEEIDNFKNEDQFMDAYVELLKQSITLIYLLVQEKYCNGELGLPKKINKNDAIIGGNLTRLIKLNTSFLENICNGKIEICYILQRCIAETTVNLEYMLSEGEEKVLRNYIKNSLITEKELWNTITSNIENNNGEKQHIEHRMQNSINRSFDESDFDLEEVNRSSKWKSLSKRAESVAGPMFYNIYYGLGSHSVHGNWQDILINNLERFEDGFKLNLEWNSPRPQIIDGPIGLNLRMIESFIEHQQIENKDLIKKKIEILNNYQTDLINAHEKSLRT